MSWKSTYVPINPSKCINSRRGLPVRCLSHWERQLCRWLDENGGVLEWGSEVIVIPYKSKIDGKMHRYYVDFVIRFAGAPGKDGITLSEGKTMLVEVKPRKQTAMPILKEGANMTRRHKKAVVTYAVNDSKWAAAKEFAESQGWEWAVWTEEHLKKLGISILVPRITKIKRRAW